MSNRNATIKEFAEELGISERLAYGMCRNERLQDLRIACDISVRPGKKDAIWRFDIQRYYEARKAGLV